MTHKCCLCALPGAPMQMWWDFDSGPSLLLHFGMTGGLVIRGVGAAHYKSQCITTDDAWPPRYLHLLACYH